MGFDLCGDLRRRAYRMKDCLPAYARSSLPKLISAAVTLQKIGTFVTPGGTFDIGKSARNAT
jgi:hypothetical protein